MAGRDCYAEKSNSQSGGRTIHQMRPRGREIDGRKGEISQLMISATVSIARTRSAKGPEVDLTRRRDPLGELCDQAGTYVSLIASSPIRSLAARRSGGRGPAKNGLPRPSTTGRK